MVIDRLLDALILTKDVKTDDLILGDKNAVMVAARILAYGSEYSAEIIHPVSGETYTHEFDLSQCDFKELPEDVDYSENAFEFELPVTKTKVIYRLLTGKEETSINKELESRKKLGQSTEITTRIKHAIISIDGETNRGTNNSFVDNMLSKDSLSLRQEMAFVAPDINLTQDIDMEGEMVKVDIPMTINFFWPQART